MAELEYGNRDNLFNAMKAKAPSGEILDLTYRLVERDPILRDVPTYPANNGATHFGHRWLTDITPTVSVVGGGWTSSVAQGQQYDEDMVLVRSRYQCPADVLQHMGSGAAAYRDAQEGIHEKSMQRGWTSTIIRGTAAGSNKLVNGMASRAPWNAITTDYCVDMGGSTNLRSMWLVNPGAAKFHLIHNPNNPTLGVKRTPKPQQLVTVTDTDANGSGKRWDEITEFEFEHGICICENMAIKRIANNDHTATITAATIEKIIELRLIHDNFLDGQWFLWCDPRMFINLIKLAQTEMNVIYSSDNPYRVNLPMIGDIIVRNIEALNYDDTDIQ